MRFRRIGAAGCATLLCAIMAGATMRTAADEPATAPENLYKAQLVNYPGPWAFQIGKSGIILVSDAELEALADPDKKLNLALGFEKNEKSLRQICEEAKAAGQRTLILAYDHFFTQYRPGQEGPRRLTPDMDEYAQRIAGISKFAQQYGLGLELSLLSPLEIGPAYRRATGESGFWMHYRKGVRDPQTGAFSVEMWRQRAWTNNKGTIELEDAGVRVFAFQEHTVRGTPYLVVPPDNIKEITDSAKVETLIEPKDKNRPARIRIYGRGGAVGDGLDHVLVVQQYRTPEMDYFSDNALPYLTKLLDKYADAGVKLNGLYSDEMHIQQDWNYFGHHDNGEFALRYASPGLAKRYAEKYGPQYKDFAKFMVYFCYGQEDAATDLSAKEGDMAVFGDSPEAIRQTALFRARYYHLLQNGVVDLFAKAKRHAEKRMGHQLEARAHATWAESPTIDLWRVGREPMFPSAYEYASNFVWSNTVHQAAAACFDYFKWGDFLTGNGNDHPEGGFADRDYFGLALACSTGILNDVPYSYCAHWGMPDELSRRRYALVNAYGDAGSPLHGMVQELQHRDAGVLMLYPLDLVAVEERFGSWMTQYGYANYVTTEKLLERGKVVNGAIEMAGRRFTTLVALFEPFPSKALLPMMKALAESGGRVVWSGPPPVFSLEGDDLRAQWLALFGDDYGPEQNEGRLAPGRQVVFEGAFASIPPQTILTDFLPDHIYPVTPISGTPVVARVKGAVVGTVLDFPGGGSATFLGYRPRDDQARSLGYETRNWFDVLNVLGAYPPTRPASPANDNTEFVSRNSPYLACRFPNGAVSIAPHFREVEETWPGGFARKKEEDDAYLKKNPPPSEALSLRDFRVNGHTVTYAGREAVTFRVNGKGDLIGFAGTASDRITIDGKETIFADKEMPGVAWARVSGARRVPGGAVLQMMVYGAGVVRIPLVELPASLAVVAEGATPGSRGAVVPSRIENGALVVTVSDAVSGRWLYAVPAP